MVQHIHAIRSWLNKPFPFAETPKSKLVTASLFGLFIYLFLAFFQPFGINGITSHKHTYLLGFGGITFAVMMFNFVLLRIFLPSLFDLDRWVVSKHILFSLWNIILIALFNWLYNYKVGEQIAKYHDLPSFLAITAGVGLIPVVFLTLLIERELWIRHNEIAHDVSDRLKKQQYFSESGDSITLVAESLKESLRLSPKQLVCINSEGNYSKVYYCENGKVEERLMRVPLKKVEKQLEEFDTIVRCHRSYIVNLSHIQKISGNARAFKLHISNPELAIPVSRSFPKAMIEKIKVQ